MSSIKRVPDITDQVKAEIVDTYMGDYDIFVRYKVIFELGRFLYQLQDVFPECVHVNMLTNMLYNLVNGEDMFQFESARLKIIKEVCDLWKTNYGQYSDYIVARDWSFLEHIKIKYFDSLGLHAKFKSIYDSGDEEMIQHLWKIIDDINASVAALDDSEEKKEMKCFISKMMKKGKDDFISKGKIPSQAELFNTIRSTITEDGVSRDNVYHAQEMAKKVLSFVPKDSNFSHPSLGSIQDLNDMFDQLSKDLENVEKGQEQSDELIAKMSKMGITNMLNADFMANIAPKNSAPKTPKKKKTKSSQLKKSKKKKTTKSK